MKKLYFKFSFRQFFFEVKGRSLQIEDKNFHFLGFFDFFLLKALQILWNRTHKNVPDWQQGVQFRKKPKVVNHSTLRCIKPLQNILLKNECFYFPYNILFMIFGNKKNIGINYSTVALKILQYGMCYFLNLTFKSTCFLKK